MLLFIKPVTANPTAVIAIQAAINSNYHTDRAEAEAQEADDEEGE